MVWFGFVQFWKKKKIESHPKTKRLSENKCEVGVR